MRRAKSPYVKIDELEEMIGSDNTEVQKKALDRSILSSSFKYLAPEQQEVLYLHYTLGCSMAEVAKFQHISPQGACNRHHRALERLRSIIGVED